MAAELKLLKKCIAHTDSRTTGYISSHGMSVVALNQTFSCSWHTSGTLRSIDATVSDYQAELASNECVEDTVLSDLTMRCIYEQAASLVRDGALIFQMHFEEGMSIREIAKHLRVSHTAINKRIGILLEYFKTNYEKFF